MDNRESATIHNYNILNESIGLDSFIRDVYKYDSNKDWVMSACKNICRTNESITDRQRIKLCIESCIYGLQKYKKYDKNIKSLREEVIANVYNYFFYQGLSEDAEDVITSSRTLTPEEQEFMKNKVIIGNSDTLGSVKDIYAIAEESKSRLHEYVNFNMFNDSQGYTDLVKRIKMSINEESLDVNMIKRPAYVLFETYTNNTIDNIDNILTECRRYVSYCDKANTKVALSIMESVVNNTKKYNYLDQINVINILKEHSRILENKSKKYAYYSKFKPYTSFKNSINSSIKILEENINYPRQSITIDEYYRNMVTLIESIEVFNEEKEKIDNSKPKTQQSKFDKFKAKLADKLTGLYRGASNQIIKAKESISHIGQDLSAAEKQMSRSLDTTLTRLSDSFKKAAAVEERDKIVEGRVLPSASKCIKFAIMTGALYAINPALAIIGAIGSIAASKSTNERQRKLMEDEISVELRLVKRQIDRMESEGAKEDDQNLKYLYKLEMALERELQKIKYNQKHAAVLMPTTSNSGTTSGN